MLNNRNTNGLKMIWAIKLMFATLAASLLVPLQVASAGEAASNEIDAVTAAETSTSPYFIGSSVTFNVSVDFGTSGGGYDDDDDTTIRGALTAGSGGSLTAVAAGATITDGGDTCNLSATTPVISVTCGATDGDNFANSVLVGTYTFVPTTVGSHTLTFWHDQDLDGVVDGGEVNVTKTFSVSDTIAVPTSAISSLSLKLVSATNSVKNPVEINWGADTSLAVFNPGEVGQLRIAGALTSYPSGGFVQSYAAVGVFGAGAVDSVPDNSNETSSGAIYFASSAVDGGDILGNDVKASLTAGFGSFAFTPSVAGDYTLTIWHDADLDGIIDTLETRQTITITVGAQSSYSQTLSTVFTQDGAGTSAADATSSLYPIHGPKAIANAQLGSATINLKDALGSDITTADAITISAYVTGVGFVTASETDTTPIATGCTGITTRTVSWVANAVDTLYICADGTAGSGSVVISTTSAAGVTTALKTINYSTFGAVAKLAIEAQYVNVLRAGGGTQGVTTDVQPVTYVNHPALVIAATDANGNLVEGLTVGTVSSDLTKISAVTAVEGTGWFGPGYYLSAITTAASSVSGDTATATYRVLDPATGFTTYLTAVANFTFGGSPATVTLSTDAKDYAPGAKGTLTVTAKDSSGNPVADRDYSDFFTAAGVSSTVANVAAGLPGAAVNVMAKGVKTYTFYAPGTRGEFTLAGTLGTSAATASQGTVVSVKATVTDAGFDAVADAAAEAIDAANAATDAANLAAEAADAATVAAEEARDAADAATAAIEELATQVATLMAALKAQITTLANTVAKIAKKIKA